MRAHPGSRTGCPRVALAATVARISWPSDMRHLLAVRVSVTARVQESSAEVTVRRCSGSARRCRPREVSVGFPVFGDTLGETPARVLGHSGAGLCRACARPGRSCPVPSLGSRSGQASRTQRRSSVSTATPLGLATSRKLTLTRSPRCFLRFLSEPSRRSL